MTEVHTKSFVITFSGNGEKRLIRSSQPMRFNERQISCSKRETALHSQTPASIAWGNTSAFSTLSQLSQREYTHLLMCISTTNTSKHVTSRFSFSFRRQDRAQLKQCVWKCGRWIWGRVW